MAAQNKKLKIEFTGDLSGLSIVVNGKTLYLDRNGENGKENKYRSPAQINLQKNHSVISTFASCVNKIPAIKQVWKKSLFSKSLKQSYGTNKSERQYAGKAANFNKIMAANRKIHQDFDYPTGISLFVPDNLVGMPHYDAILLGEELIVDINFMRNGERMKFTDKEKRLTGAAVISAYNPKKRSKIKFEAFPKWEIISNFIPSDTYQINLSITVEEQEILKKYKDCYLYFTIVTETELGKLIRCFNTRGESSSLADYPVSPVLFTNGSKD